MVQNISNEEYLEIKNLCLFCFKKYFKKWFNLKDDLVQEGITNVLKYINDFDKIKSSFSTFCIRYAYYGMLTYLNNLYGKGRKYNNFDYSVISLDSVISSDNDKTTLSDLLPDNNLNILYNSILNKNCIKSCIKSALLKCCSYKEKSLKTLFDYKKRYKQFSKKSFKQEKYNILCDYLKTLSVSETAKNCGVSRQFVSQYKIEFAKCLKKELEDSGYYN